MSFAYYLWKEPLKNGSIIICFLGCRRVVGINITCICQHCISDLRHQTVDSNLRTESGKTSKVNQRSMQLEKLHVYLHGLSDHRSNYNQPHHWTVPSVCKVCAEQERNQNLLASQEIDPFILCLLLAECSYKSINKPWEDRGSVHHQTHVWEPISQYDQGQVLSAMTCKQTAV